MKKINSSYQISIGIVLSYMSTGINMLIQLLYTPIMIRLLGQSEYGVYTLVGSVVSYLGLFNLGFTGAYLRFYSINKSNKDNLGIARLNGMFLLVFMTVSVVALICGWTLSNYPREIFGDKLSQSEIQTAQILMRILVLNIALTLPSGLFESIVSAHEKFIFQRLLSLLGVVFNPILCLPLLIMGFGSVVVVSITTLITIVKLLVNVLYCVGKLKIKICFSNLSIKLLREISQFSFFLFVNMIIDQINWSVDKYILGRVSGTESVAVYGVGAQINSLFLGFSTTISSVYAPRVNIVAVNSNKRIDFTKIMIHIGRIQCMILGFIASGFVFFGKFFITHIYASEKYLDAYYVAILLIISAFVPLIQSIGIDIQRALNKHYVRTYIYLIMAIFNVFISIPLAKQFGPIGSALGTAVSLLLGNGIIMNIYYYKGLHINIKSFWLDIICLLKGFVVPLVVGIIVIKLIRFNDLIDFFIWIVVYSVIYFISIYNCGMNVDERETLRRIIYKIKSVVKS